jgi:hypothetical protein
MKYNPNFDVDSVLDILRTVNEKYPEGSPEDEALRIAAVALFYVRETQKLEDYREFFRAFYTPAIDYIVVAQTFATREEADAWLALGKTRDGETDEKTSSGLRVETRRVARIQPGNPGPLTPTLSRRARGWWLSQATPSTWPSLPA